MSKTVATIIIVLIFFPAFLIQDETIPEKLKWPWKIYKNSVVGISSAFGIVLLVALIGIFLAMPLTLFMETRDAMIVGLILSLLILIKAKFKLENIWFLRDI